MKSEKNILLAFILNIVFSIFEFLGGTFTNSISIVSDSIHDMGDALTIGVSYLLEKKSKRKPDEIYTYGYARYSVLGAVITTCILITGSIIVIIGAIKRLFNPVEINYNGTIVLAIIGVIVNVLAAYFTRKGDSLNQKSVNLHMLEDVFNWLVVLIGSVLMKFTNLNLIDPIMSIFLALFILVNSLKNVKEITNLFLERIPENISLDEVKNALKKIKEVVDVHHIHIWSIDGINNYATLHVVVKKHNVVIKDTIRKSLKEYNISHVTIELESENEKCENNVCELKYQKNNHHHHH